MPDASSAALAAHLLGRDTSASAVAVRRERKARIQAAIDALEPVDREVLDSAPLRRADQRRGRAYAGDSGIGRQQALRSCPSPAQGGSQLDARRQRGVSTVNATDGGTTRDPFDRLAESFLERFRRGERPSISEYIENNPDHASDIRDLFPALVEVEQLKSAGGADSACQGGKRLPVSKLGDYQIFGIVGEGGMGIVYEAIRESLRSRVALKIMHPRFRENPGYLRRFHVEACAAASLHHTNIVSVFDYGETEGVVYYAMPYIAGQGLEKVLLDVKRIRNEQSSDFGRRGHPEEPPRDRRKRDPLRTCHGAWCRPARLDAELDHSWPLDRAIHQGARRLRQARVHRDG